MTVYNKYNIVYRLQKWMDSVPGQTFLNYAYSWGASIVILGTLFKLTHLPGANLMLFIGMGTEVCVFFISAFDRPFDKTEEGRVLPTHVEESEEANLQGVDAERAGQPLVIGGVMQPAMSGTAVEGVGTSAGGNTVVGGGTIVLGGGYAGNVAGTQSTDEDTETVKGDGNAETQPATTEQIAAAISQPAWLQQQQQVSPEMEEATTNYVEELKKLTEMLGKVSDQSERLTRDSEEMENLNRTLTGICKVYEMQLKGASAQIGTIDQINEQSRKMAGQIEQLNKIYARMIEAMTVNMKAAAPSQAADLNA